LPEFPDPEAPPGNQLIAPVGKFPFLLRLELFVEFGEAKKLQGCERCFLGLVCYLDLKLFEVRLIELGL
jgi:hypothetical protein